MAPSICNRLQLVKRPRTPRVVTRLVGRDWDHASIAADALGLIAVVAAAFRDHAVVVVLLGPMAGDVTSSAAKRARVVAVETLAVGPLGAFAVVVKVAPGRLDRGDEADPQQGGE
jgi:hypothetical protein